MNEIGAEHLGMFPRQPILDYIVATVGLPQQLKENKNNQIKHPYVIQRMRRLNSVDSAFEELLLLINTQQERMEVENKLRLTLQFYLNPSDTLVNRFISPNNQNLQNNPHFVQGARNYLNTFNMNDDQLRAHINDDSQRIRSKYDHPLPPFLADHVSDLRLSASFIEILFHRLLICKTHIEIEREPSIYEHAIPILLPCLAILLKWDQEQKDPPVNIYYRLNNELKQNSYPLIIHYDDVPELDQIWSMPPDDRQNFMREYLIMRKELLQQWKDVNSDYHLWLMVIRYWYLKRKPPSVYLYAVIVCLVEFVFLRTDKELSLIKKQLDSLSSSFGNSQTRQSVNSTTCQQIFKSFERRHNNIRDKKLFDNSITHELNCLQTIYMYGLNMNEFFNKPFPSLIYPHYFISGLLFHAFVYHYKAEHNLPDAMRTLFLKNTVILNFIQNLYTCISSDVPNEH